MASAWKNDVLQLLETNPSKETLNVLVDIYVRRGVQTVIQTIVEHCPYYNIEDCIDTMCQPNNCMLLNKRKISSYMLSKEPPIDYICPNHGYSLLWFANNEKEFCHLLNRGVDINYVSPSGTILHYIIQHYRTICFIKYISSTIDIGIKDSHGRLALHYINYCVEDDVFFERTTKPMMRNLDNDGNTFLTSSSVLSKYQLNRVIDIDNHIFRIPSIHGVNPLFNMTSSMYRVKDKYRLINKLMKVDYLSIVLSYRDIRDDTRFKRHHDGKVKTRINNLFKKFDRTVLTLRSLFIIYLYKNYYLYQDLIETIPILMLNSKTYEISRCCL